MRARYSMLGWGSEWCNKEFVSTLDVHCWELVAKRPKITRHKSKKCIRLLDNLKRWKVGYKKPSDLNSTLNFGKFVVIGAVNLFPMAEALVLAWQDLPQKKGQMRFCSLCSFRLLLWQYPVQEEQLPAKYVAVLFQIQKFPSYYVRLFA